MSISVPEKPLLIYPSIAKQLGVEAALLFQIAHDLIDAVGVEDETSARCAVISSTRWGELTPFWHRERLQQLEQTLLQQQCVQIVHHIDSTVHLTLLNGVNAHTAAPPPAPSLPASVATETSATTRLPVLDSPPAYARRPLPSRHNPIRERGPAPVFGGSTGWKRKSAEKDELQQLFERHEERNQQLHVMYLGWEPSELFYTMLPRHQIPREFVDQCIDEFILYYIDKERKESNWDQKFLAWIKREWVQKQTREARDQRQESSTFTTGPNHENTRRDTRENRKRVTAAIMDIKDTDW